MYQFCSACTPVQKKKICLSPIILNVKAGDVTHTTRSSVLSFDSNQTLHLKTWGKLEIKFYSTYQAFGKIALKINKSISNQESQRPSNIFKHIMAGKGTHIQLCKMVGGLIQATANDSTRRGRKKNGEEMYDQCTAQIEGKICE